MKKAISSSSSSSVSEDEDIEMATPRRRLHPKRNAKAIQQQLGELGSEHFWALFLLFALAVIIFSLALCEVWPPPVKALSDIAARRRALVAISVLEVMGVIVFVVLGCAGDVSAAATRCLRHEETRRMIRLACNIIALMVFVLVVSIGLAFLFVPA